MPAQIYNTLMIPIHEYHDLEQQLAASQAREKVLRDRLVYVDAYLEERDENFDNLRGDINIELSMPTDDTALKAALAAERQRCAKAAEEYADGPLPLSIAQAIRALGDEE